MENKSSGNYIMSGEKISHTYFRHHFSKNFTFWMLGVLGLLSRFTIFLAPIFQKLGINLNYQIDKSGECIFSKGFEYTDKKRSYLSTLLLNLLFILIIVASLALLYLIPTIIRYFSLHIIAFQQFASTPDVDIFSFVGITGLIDNNIAASYAGKSDFFRIAELITFYAYIPFGVAGIVIVIYGLQVFQTALHISFKNPELPTSDIAYNAFATLKKKGGRLFLINLFYIFQIVVYAALIVVPVFVLNAFWSNFGIADENLAKMIIYSYIALFVIISFFAIPRYLCAYKVSVIQFMEANADSKAVVIVYKEKVKDEKETYIALTPVESADGEVKYVRPEELKKTKTKKVKEEKKDVA